MDKKAPQQVKKVAKCPPYNNKISWGEFPGGMSAYDAPPPLMRAPMLIDLLIDSFTVT